MVCGYPTGKDDCVVCSGSLVYLHSDCATAKMYERQHLEEQSPAPPPRKKAKLAKQGTASTAVKGKSKQPSKMK